MLSRLAALLLLSLLAAMGGYALASTISGDAQGCRAAEGHWQVFAESCRY